MPEQVLATLIPIGVIALIFFLICREIVTWYFKLNQIVSRLDTVIKHLETISKSAQAAPSLAAGDWTPSGDSHTPPQPTPLKGALRAPGTNLPTP